MQIMGSDPQDAETGVHTIDIWFSEARGRWIVQRLDGRGDPIGHSHSCRTQGEAKACLADWLRRHPETYLATPLRTATKRVSRATG